MKSERLSIEELKALPREEVYKLNTSKRFKRITADTPIESENRTFRRGARAYFWTNEAVCDLEDVLRLDLSGRDMLIVGASGDPFGAFAYLGARNQVGFDTSHRAVLWDELKIEATTNLEFDEFKGFMGLDKRGNEDSEKGKKTSQEIDYAKLLLPKLSAYGQDVFGELFKRHQTLRQISREGVFFRGGGYTGYFPASNIYTTSKEKYDKAREGLRKNPPILVLGSMLKALNMVDHKFSGFYGSNIFDHFRNPQTGNFDYSEKAIGGFLETLDRYMERDAVMIFQFEWSPQARENAQRTLERMGYKFEISSNSKGRGYGNMSVSKRK